MAIIITIITFAKTFSFSQSVFTFHTKFTKHTKARIVNSRVPPDAYTRLSRQRGRSDLPFCEFRGSCVRLSCIKVPPQNDHLSLV